MTKEEVAVVKAAIMNLIMAGSKLTGYENSFPKDKTSTPEEKLEIIHDLIYEALNMDVAMRALEAVNIINKYKE